MGNKIRPRITPEEYEVVVEYRKQHQALIDECDASGVPHSDVKHYWFKSEKFSMFVGNKGKDYLHLREETISEMKKYAPNYPTVKYPKYKDAHLLVIDPADIHIGKLCKAIETGDEYNEKIAVNRIREGVNGILSKVISFNVDEILLIIGNDILHVDTPKSQTTAGTFQDSSIMWYEAFTIAKQIYIETIEKLMQVAPVRVQYDPSNHDYTNGFFLADTLNSWFSKSKNVTFNVTPAHRKYFKYHSNLIGTTHGDGAKLNDLPLLMAQEAAEHWAGCKHRYFFTHHIHHKSSKDIGSVCIESLRSASGTDSWHHRNGYQHSPKAIEGFLHHKEHGQIARIQHIF
jgi:hypothetical protein